MESESRLQPSLVKCLLELTDSLERRNVRYALIGGLAVGYRSQPRYTQDVDLLLHVPQPVLPALLEDLCEHGFVCEPGSVISQWTREHMTMLSFEGVRVDWLKPVLPCFEHVLDTARPEFLLGRMIRIASAEALIFLKLVASRPQDLVDIQNLLAANRGGLDLDWIRREWQTIFDADDPRLTRFEALVRDFYNSPSTA
jgi:predicted nucleotidyltransferase